jgi:tetratricopeptide (TPR) repeat protein
MRITGSQGWIGVAVILLALAVSMPAQAEWEKGVAAYNGKDYATAAKEFEEVTKTNPGFAGGYYMLGLAQTAQDQLAPAVANLRKAVELDAKNASYQVALGQALLKTKEYQQAYGLLKSLDMATMDAQYRSSYALLFAQAATKSGQPQDAIRVLTAQTRADGNNHRLYQALGVAYDEAGDDGKAFDAFKRAFELNPKDQATGRSAVQSGILAARRSSSDAQKQRYYQETGQIAERLASTSPTFEHNLLAGETWMGAKEYRRALEWFDKATAKQPNNVLVHYYRSQCNTALKKYDTALSDLQTALRIGASGKLRTQIYSQMGYVYASKRDFASAANAYAEAGNQSKAAEMRANQEKQAQNVQAEAEQAELRRTIAALELQIEELEAIGEVDDANELRKQLDELKKHIQ